MYELFNELYARGKVRKLYNGYERTEQLYLTAYGLGRSGLTCGSR